MAKILICTALLFVTLVCAYGPPRGGHGGNGQGGYGGNGGDGQGGGHGGNGQGGSGGNNNWISKLCQNVTVATQFVTELQQLITTLQTNGSFTGVLGQWTNLISYVQNTNYTSLISSNCTSFFTGLVNAKNLDTQATALQMQYAQTAGNLVLQIIQNLIGNNDYPHDGH